MLTITRYSYFVMGVGVGVGHMTTMVKCGDTTTIYLYILHNITGVGSLAYYSNPHCTLRADSLPNQMCEVHNGKVGGITII